MKKLVTFLALTSLSALSFAQVNVTFSVDLGPTQLGNNAVFVVGNFQGETGNANDWTPTDPNFQLNPTGAGSTIYTGVYTLPVGTYEYKFQINDPANPGTWTGAENNFATPSGNRQVTVTAANPFLIPTSCFNVLAAGNCPAQVDTLNVTFQVDMTNAIAKFGAPGGGVVTVAGGFQNWSPGTTFMHQASAGSTVYQTDPIRIPEGDISYKFLFGNAWGYDESVPAACAGGGNRTYTVSGTQNQNVTIPAVCWNTCEATCAPLGAAREVKFWVDASQEVVDPLGIRIDGDFQLPFFQGDGSSRVALINEGNGLYSYTKTLYPGDYVYRFYNGNSGENFDFTATNPPCGVPAPVGTPRRLVTVVAGAGVQNVGPFIYNDCALSVSTKNQSEAAAFTMSPNPTANETIIRFTNKDNQSFGVTVTDVLGRTVRSNNNLNGTQTTIAKGNLATGIYNVTLTLESGERFTKKLIIE